MKRDDKLLNNNLMDDFVRVGFLPSPEQINEFKASIEDPEMVDMDYEISQFKIN